MTPYINSDRAEHTNNTSQKPTANRQVKAVHGPLSSAARKVGQAIYQALTRNAALQTPECLRIPADVARNLRSLDVSNKQLHSLPDHLPPNLRTLDVSKNQLQTLPQQLPKNLVNLDVSYNRLQTLPNKLPSDLLNLNAKENQLREVDLNIFEHLPRSAQVYLNDNPLSLQTVTCLDIRQANGAEPQIHYPSIQDTYQALWQQWASEPHDAREQRDQAVREFCKWFETNLPALQAGEKATDLFFDRFNLTSLPPLPKGLTELNIRGDRDTYELPEGLTHLSYMGSVLNTLHDKLPTSLVELGLYLSTTPMVLPENLPNSLRRLKAKYNTLTELPEHLPNRLKEILLVDNLLTHLPEHLPDRLNILSVNGNPLTRLPENLPINLIKLEVTGNHLTYLPEKLPAGLRFLSIKNNQFTRLPENLPGNITQLHAQRNQLTNLPENLPRSLKKLFVDYNALTAFPKNLPLSLHELTMTNNCIVDLPESAISFIMGMNRHVRVDLRENPLSQQAINRLNALQDNPDYAGAKVRYTIYEDGSPQDAVLRPAPVADAALQAAPTQIDVADAQPVVAQAPEPSADLGQAAAAWATPPNPTNIAATARLWQGFANEPGADEFKLFLDRLRQSVNVNDPAFQRSVGQWLAKLENNPVLRADTFAVGIGATESCEDRISLTYNNMRKVGMAADVSRGKYDRRLPDLITLARGMFRLEQLENIAHETTATLAQTHDADQVDEIGVYLGYQVMLREPLALPVDTANMAFFRTSGLTQNHLDQAQARVQQAERHEFANYLATDFLPWQWVLQRLAPEQHAQAQEELINAVGNEFTRRLNTRLQTMVLYNNPDAERSLGAQVRADIAYEVYGQLTRDFLASKGMLNLLR